MNKICAVSKGEPFGRAQGEKNEKDSRAETDRWMRKKTTFLSEKCLRRVQKIDVIYTHLIDVVNRPVEEQ